MFSRVGSDNKDILSISRIDSEDFFVIHKMSIDYNWRTRDWNCERSSGFGFFHAHPIIEFRSITSLMTIPEYFHIREDRQAVFLVNTVVIQEWLKNPGKKLDIDMANKNVFGGWGRYDNKVIDGIIDNFRWIVT